MSNYTKVSIAAVVILFLVVGFAWCANNEAKADDREIADGVTQIMVTDHSRYIMDTRFDLCFYETTTVNGVSVVPLTPGQCKRMEK